MKRRLLGASVALAVAGYAGTALSDLTPPPFDPKDPKMANYISGDKRSGYTFAEPETRAMQDDDFQNPAFLWVEKGEKLWTHKDGEAGKSCADCHGEPEKMKGVGASYPKFDAKLGKLVNLEQRIMQCRKDQMKAAEWKWESDPLLSMTTFVKYQSRGMPIKVDVEGPAKPFFEKGREFYDTRRGLNDMACKHCHIDNPGNYIRTELLSQGMANGFPTYRLKWQGLGSFMKRVRGCNEEIRAEPLAWGHDDYVNLELYLAWRAQGLQVETPSVRK